MTNKHTFVVCAYGDSPYLEDCLKSLKAQTIASELMLYTSTPSPYIEELCQWYQFPLYTKEGGSIGKDWNNALSFVETPFATIAHQDDIYEPSYAEEILKGVSEETLIAFSDYFEVKENQRRFKSLNLRIKRLMLATMKLLPQSRWLRLRVLAFGNPISCPAVTYQLSKLGDFQFSPDMKVSIDWFAWYQIAQFQGRFDYIAKPLMGHRIHEDSETSQTIEDQTRTKEDRLMYQLFWPKPVADVLMYFYEKSQKSNG